MNTPLNSLFSAQFAVTQGRLRLDDMSVIGGGSVLGKVDQPLPVLTLDGGALQYSGPTASSPMPITLSTVGGAVEVSNVATRLTLTGPITSGGVLTKTGPGVLVLNNLASRYVGGITVSGGRLDVSDDAQLGVANPTVNPAGTLRYTASTTTARTFTLNSGTLEAPGGVVLTLDGATVGGGFLRGAGTFAVTGGTSLTGVTTFGSTTVSQFGAASYTNFTNGGLLTITGGLADPVVMNGFSNRGSATISVGARTRINAADFESYGVFVPEPPDCRQRPVHVAGQHGFIPMYFNGGSRTFIGTPATASPPVAGVDLHGQNLVIAGGLFVNNGFVADSSGTPGSVIVDYGALYKGAGTNFVNIITQNGGKVQAGNSPGSMGFGRFVFGPGGVNNYVFAINDATGTAGPNPDALGYVSGWGLVKAVKAQFGTTTTSGDFLWTATPTDRLTFAIDTLVNPTMVGTDVGGLMDHFNPLQPYTWPALRWTGMYSGPTDSATLNADTSFDISGFLNPVAGTFGWNLDPAGETLSLVYTPTAVPEPGTLALVGLAAVGLAWRRRKVVLPLPAALVLAIAVPAPAQYVWTGDYTTEWNYAPNWSPSGINYPNSASATATFGNVAGLHTINISPSVFVQSLSFVNTTGNYTLTSSANQTLSGLTSITVDPAVTGTHTINLANVASGSLLFAGNNLTITENGSSGMTLGPNTVIGTPGPGGIVVAGTGVHDHQRIVCIGRQ